MALNAKIISMKLSYNWLNDFVSLDEFSLEEIADKLTMKAFEVEEVLASKEILGDDIVLGEIKEIVKHPDADKLNITQTCVGDETFQIVCGAKNIAVGQKVPVSLVGATVTNRKDGSKFQIKKSKIRGVESMGMLCSADELGFTEDEVNAIKEKQGDGIYILSDIAGDNPLGTPIAKVLNQEVDYVLEVGARSNRGDALSVLGQAKELAAILEKDMKLAKDQFSKDVFSTEFSKLSTEILDKVELNQNSSLYNFDSNIRAIKPKISSQDDCQLFYTVNIEGIEIKESPQWLKDRIEAMGTGPVNNIVDISNYVLLELGQPMHFYDRDKISGDELLVRRAQEGEKMNTLDESKHEMTETNLVIADSQGPVSMAGVMGGLESSITVETKNIVIEVAVFTPSVVRKSSRAAGIESESKRRYERGVDKASSKLALLRAVELISKIAAPEGAKISIGEIYSSGSEEINKQSVALELNQVKRLLGVDIPKDTIVQILSRLEINLISEKDEILEFSIPSYRQLDMTREADLIEEIGRLYGFDNIPAEQPATLVSMLANEIKEQNQIKAKIKESFIAAGFSEVQLSSLIGESLEGLDSQSVNLQKFKHIKGSRDVIKMDNPLSREHRVLRQSIVPGLIQAASRNYSYDKTVDIKLFEIGKVYAYNTQEGQEPNRDNSVEDPKISAVFVKNEQDWTQSKAKTLAENFFSFKTIIENLYPNAKFKSLDKDVETSLAHPGISAHVINNGREIGYIAKLHPSVTKEWDLPDETYVFELSFPMLTRVKFKPIASTPVVERDITVDGPDDLDSQAILDLMKKNGSKDLKTIKLVSLYRRDPKSVEDPNAVKSTSFRLKWQSPTETLSGDEVDSEIDKIKSQLEKKLSVTFRA